MVTALLVCSALAAAPPAPSASDRAAYESARAQAGRDSQAHVRLALWCEARGMAAERTKHLATAVLLDPRDATARGLMGLVAFRGRWQRPDAVAEGLRDDPEQAARRAEYLQRRAKAPDTADAHWKLALWCEQNGLRDEATAHLTSVVRIDAGREAAWKRLGYRRQGSRWVFEGQLAAEKAERESQKQADRRWRPRLEKWRGWLADKSKRAEAEKALAGVVDPRAVPMVWSVFAEGDAERQRVAVQVLGQIDAADASRALALLAVFGGSAEVRRSASETLSRRDAREFAHLLIGLIRDPIRYEVRHVGGPGSPGELFVAGEKVNLKRVYATPTPPNAALQPGDRVVYDENGYPVVQREMGTIEYPAIVGSNLLGLGSVPSKAVEDRLANLLSQSGLGPQGRELARKIVANANQNASMLGPFSWRIGDPSPGNPQPGWNFGVNAYVTEALTLQIPVGRMAAEAQKAALSSELHLEQDVRRLEAYNQAARMLGDRVLPILRAAAGRDLGEERETWQAWWRDEMGIAIAAQKSGEKPTVIEEIAPTYQPRPVSPVVVATATTVRRHSCFAAGTLVRTLAGPRAIETLRVGDVVLTQSTKSGALGYHPILAVHHNPPSRTFRVKLGGEAIVSSAFHRFWIVGRGWVMARDLNPGDVIRTLRGPLPVEVIDDDRVQPVFNLDVAEDADFFVGQTGALVHDHTLPDLRQPPFDAPPSLAAAR